MDLTPDKETLDRIRAGDRDACERLVRGHYERVYRFLLHETLDPHLSADLTQEAFAAAWQGIGDFNGKASFNTWLHQIAYRKLVDGVRKSERHKQAQQRLRREWVERPESSALQKIVRDEETKQLYEALQDLDGKNRDVLVLRYLQGMTVAETAEVMGEPMGTTKWRCSQALSRLKILLSKDFLNEVRK